MLVCVLSVVLVLVSEICVRCGGFRRLPALKVSFATGGRFGDVAWLLGLGCLVWGVGEAVSFLSCSVVRFRLRWVGGLGLSCCEWFRGVCGVLVRWLSFMGCV